MKTLKSKTKPKFIALTLSLILIILGISPTSAFAQETDTNIDNSVLVDESSEYYHEALNVLGISEEEAKECNIYAVDGTKMSQTRGVTIPNNSGFYYFPEFTFSESNGGSYWTCTGNQIKWGVSWHGTYDTNYDLRLGIYLYRYQDTELNHVWLYNDGNSYTSDWISTYAQDHRFTYYCNYLSQSGVGYATVRMYVATRTV